MYKITDGDMLRGANFCSRREVSYTRVWIRQVEKSGRPTSETEHTNVNRVVRDGEYVSRTISYGASSESWDWYAISLTCVRQHQTAQVAHTSIAIHLQYSSTQTKHTLTHAHAFIKHDTADCLSVLSKVIYRHISHPPGRPQHIHVPMSHPSQSGTFSP